MEIIMIVDKSGSMSGLVSDVVGGFNRFVEEQKAAGGGDDPLTLVQFDQRIETTYDRVKLSAMGALTEENYAPGGYTALLDAVGKTVASVRDRTSKDDPAIFCIMTDGHENASTEYNRDAVRKLIESMQGERKWRFVFIGAGIDAFGEASMLGIDKTFVRNVAHDGKGIRGSTAYMGQTTADYRTTVAKQPKP